MNAHIATFIGKVNGIGNLVFLDNIMLIAAVMLIASQPLTGAEPPGADVTALRELTLPPVEKKPWVFEGFPIMAWWRPPGTKTLEDFRCYKDAGNS
jgi:hypothetical protein